MCCCLMTLGTCTAGAGVAPEFTYTNVLVEDLLKLEVERWPRLRGFRVSMDYEFDAACIILIILRPISILFQGNMMKHETS